MMSIGSFFTQGELVDIPTYCIKAVDVTLKLK